MNDGRVEVVAEIIAKTMLETAQSEYNDYLRGIDSGTLSKLSHLDYTWGDGSLAENPWLDARIKEMVQNLLRNA